MKSIKKIAGEILLYFYWIQRKDIAKLSDSNLSFQLRHFKDGRKEKGPKLNHRDETIFNVEKFKKYNDGDLYNSLNYLYEGGMINFNKSSSNVGDNIINIKLTAYGIDIIEGIERGEEEKKEFNVTFNFNIYINVTVDSLLKTELGSLIKVSLL
jgi:hypothetical protein